ncbi:MAG: hypothetical protein ACXVBU_08520, partial [Ktedonobacteraceae bacterium]
SSLSPITPAISIGQHYTSSDFVEPSINQTATFGKIPVVKEDSDITLARRTNSMQGDEGFGANMYWSTEPVEWSPIGAETGDSMPSIATEFLKGKPILTESPTNESRLKTDIDEEFKNEAKAADSRLKKLLPILVVILLLVGLIAALLSSFILPNLSSSGNTGKIRQVVEVPSIQASLSIRTSSMSIFK